MAIKPLYVRIFDELKRRITEGELQPGDKLPTFVELQREFSASTTAVRNAMLLLQSEGLVEGHQGKGVYVAGEPGTTQ